jgi:NAD(P)-dependent dehydrogenase (short-subunit alcohol dehydrogenase family)
MAEDFMNKTVVITGGGTGLGKAMAMEFARGGANVVIASRNADHLNAAKAEIESASTDPSTDPGRARKRPLGPVLAVPTDVRHPDQVEALVNQSIERFGKIDVLINNAAGNFVVPAEKLTINGWNSVINIVLNGTWYCSSIAGRKMIEQGGGTILNIIATFAWTGSPGVVHSASAKAGVLAMTKTLAAEWGRYNIRVNALAPGVMVTEGASKNLLFDNADAQSGIKQGIPLNRFASVEEIADIAVFLCSHKAAYISGDVITADGGRCLDGGFLGLMEHQTQ